MLNSLMYKLSYYRLDHLIFTVSLYLSLSLFFLGLFASVFIAVLQFLHVLLEFRFVETDGRGFDRVRRTEIGKKYFKLSHFEEVL